MTLEIACLLVFIVAVVVYMLITDTITKRIAAVVGAVSGLLYVFIVLVRTIK